jgi:hypothetical protein
MTDTTYNGWKNHATWNVALWIGGDEGLYNLAKDCENYFDFQNLLRELESVETPDKVAWNDSGLDIAELDEMIQELGK